jgi:hypothetical protein
MFALQLKIDTLKAQKMVRFWKQIESNQAIVYFEITWNTTQIY